MLAIPRVSVDTGTIIGSLGSAALAMVQLSECCIIDSLRVMNFDSFGTEY